MSEKESVCVVMEGGRERGRDGEKEEEETGVDPQQQQQQQQQQRGVSLCQRQGLEFFSLLSGPFGSRWYILIKE
jgi:hypothetical protein